MLLCLSLSEYGNLMPIETALLNCAPQLAGPSSIGVNHVINHQGFIGHLASTKGDSMRCAMMCDVPSLQAIDQEKTHLVQRATMCRFFPDFAKICCEKSQSHVTLRLAQQPYQSRVKVNFQEATPVLTSETVP